MMQAFSRSELMYTKYTQNVCIQNVSHISTNVCVHFVFEMYTECIQNVSHSWTNFCIQNVQKMFVQKMYTTLRQTFVYTLDTKFGWCSSFDFVYKIYAKVYQNTVYNLHTFCINFVYISCIHLVKFCIQDVQTVFVWVLLFNPWLIIGITLVDVLQNWLN